MEEEEVKILSIAIPCYNSAAYMRRCIDSLLPGGDDVEILIVDDGSAKDDTAEIADEYEKNYPGIVRAIHQENGGHGEAVNAGLRNATGLYYKVVDSDDWVDEDAYLEIIRTLKELVAGPETVDMFISNFVYDKVGAKRKKVMRYGAFPENEIFHWEEAKKTAHWSLHIDAFRDLPYHASSGVRAGASKAYVLCGQSVCIPAAALCKKSLLSKSEFLSLFYRTGRSVGE